MTRQNALLVIAAVLTSILAIVIGWRLGQRRPQPQEAEVVATPEPPVPTDAAEILQLYFPGAGGRLYAEPREAPADQATESRLALVVEGLLGGPQSNELYPALPEGTTLGWLFLSPDNVAYVDLELGGESPLPAWGSRREMLAVYSVVNSILVNIPEIRSVVLLRNGQQPSTFAGHLDISQPLLANRELVASR